MAKHKCPGHCLVQFRNDNRFLKIVNENSFVTVPEYLFTVSFGRFQDSVVLNGSSLYQKVTTVVINKEATLQTVTFVNIDYYAFLKELIALTV